MVHIFQTITLTQTENSILFIGKDQNRKVPNYNMKEIVKCQVTVTMMVN